MEETVSLAGRALTLIHLGRAPTRSALTAELGVTRATVGAVTARLRDLGLIQIEASPSRSGQGQPPQVSVRIQAGSGGGGQGQPPRVPVQSEAGSGGSSQGRPSHRLTIDPDGPVVLAAEIQPDGYEVALVGLGGRIVAAERVHGAVPADPAEALAPLARDAARLLSRYGRRPGGRPVRRCVGAALAVASAVSSPEGETAGELNLGWPAGAPVRAMLAELLRTELQRTDIDPVVVNDINAAALAEHRHGAGVGADVLLMVATGHRGVGGALVLGGTLFTGSGGLGMEAGHVTVDPEGRPCTCGNRGCLSVETDAQRFLAAAGRRPEPGTPVLDQAIAIMRGEYETDPAVRAAAAGLIAHLGLALAGLINVLNPDRILLGGLHRQLLESAPAALREAIAERSPWSRGARVPVRGAALEQASLIGAAELAWQPVLDDPAVLDDQIVLDDQTVLDDQSALDGPGAHGTPAVPGNHGGAPPGPAA